MSQMRIVSVLSGIALTFSALAAEPKEAVASAIKALKDKGSYSWTSTTEAGQFNINAKGKAEKDWAMITSEGQNGETQAVRKGDKGVLKTDDGWKTAEELRAAQAGGGGQGRGMFRAAILRTPLPLEDAEDALKGVKDLKAGDNGVYTAELTDEAAKDRASFFGRRRGGQNANPNFTPPEPKEAKASVKYWVKDGALTKMEVKSHAKLTFNGEDREIDRTTTTEFSNVGSTKVDAPAEAKKKLE
jgi:hypothetical protein